MPTSREIGRLAGVSQATVSRVLHDSDLVAPETKERVRRVLASTGYQPNLAARAMRTRRTGTVGIVIASLTNPFYPELLQALGAALAGEGSRMIVWDTEGPGAAAAIAAIEQRLVDGLIFTTALGTTEPLAPAVSSGAPVVLVNRSVSQVACDQVSSRNRETSMDVARYMVGSGHSRLGLIGADPAASTARERMEGFLTGVAACGLSAGSVVTADGGFSHPGGAAALHGMLTGPAPPSAVFCVNDLSALGALDAAKAVGVTVPDDLWLVGYDDIDMASWPSFDLTTARQPLAAMAGAAVELLGRRIAEPAAPVAHRRFDNEIVVRGTTARRPVASLGET